MNTLRLLFVGLPAVVCAVGVSLVLKIVRPNRFYGFRTSTTFSSLNAWYQINFATGIAMVAAGIVSGCVVLLLACGIIKLQPEPRYLMGILLTTLFTLLFLVPVAIYSDRFPG